MLLKYVFSQSQNFYGMGRHGIKHANIMYNLSVPELYDIASQHTRPSDFLTNYSVLADNGALVAFSGVRTGRSPKDKRIVMDDITKNEINWGQINIPISQESYNISENIAINYLNTTKNLFVIDGYAGWDQQQRLKIRVVCSRSYHALFMKNMLIIPSQQELERDFSDDNNIDFHIFNAGEIYIPKNIPGVDSETSVQVNLTKKKMIILGTQYAGEMKKGVFGVMQYYMPKKKILSMHCSATEGKEKDVTLYFGLSGTGKTTLSADSNRLMIGDDEHCWTDDGVFNIEGGCYAKCIGLSKEKEPDIYDAIKFGCILENVKFHNNDQKQRNVNYNDISITENTRACYPLKNIWNAKFPAVGGHPKNVIFLTCDAFGVLPPVSILSKEQAMYHFISGYTAKVAGTEIGITKPQPTFSAAFGEAFIPFHPTVYADLLAEKIDKHGSNVYLINTGWTGGEYGTGERMSLSITRKIVDSINNGSILKSETEQFKVFGFKIPKNIEGVDSNILNPEKVWENKDLFNVTLNNLAQQFKINFDKYRDQANQKLLSAEPIVDQQYIRTEH